MLLEKMFITLWHAGGALVRLRDHGQGSPAAVKEKRLDGSGYLKLVSSKYWMRAHSNAPVASGIEVGSTSSGMLPTDYNMGFEESSK